MRDGGTEPKALENRPMMYEWMKEYFKAFNTLSQTRQFGMGPNPISLSEILAYISIFGTDDREAFVHHVLMMDEAFLSSQAAKAQMKENPGGSRPGTKRK